MSEWQSMANAPRDGTPFHVQDTCGEFFIAKYDEYGRVLYRMHSLHRPEHYRIIDAVMDGEPVKAQVPIGEPWPETYEHNWVVWTRGFEFDPACWLPLIRPTGARL